MGGKIPPIVPLVDWSITLVSDWLKESKKCSANILPNSRTFCRTFCPTNTDLILEHNLGKKKMIENIFSDDNANKLYLDLFSVFLQL